MCYTVQNGAENAGVVKLVDTPDLGSARRVLVDANKN